MDTGKGEDMRIIYAQDYHELSRWSAHFVAGLIRGKPSCVLGLPTGSTPIGMYAQLVRMYQEGLDLKNIQTFNLDEYVGLPPSHNQSYHFFMQHTFFDQVNLIKANYHVPNGRNPRLDLECQHYEEKIQEAGGINLMILGLGPNGHIGFNEPDSHLGTKTHVASLTIETIQANSRFFESESDVPRRAITMGIGSIMQAEEILLLVSGVGKREVLRQALFGEVTTSVPASILQLHPHLIVVTDFLI